MITSILLAGCPKAQQAVSTPQESSHRYQITWGVACTDDMLVCETDAYFTVPGTNSIRFRKENTLWNIHVFEPGDGCYMTITPPYLIVDTRANQDPITAEKVP